MNDPFKVKNWRQELLAQSKLNGFVFVDVLLFAIYLNEDTFNPKELHEDVVYNVIFYDQIGPN